MLIVTTSHLFCKCWYWKSPLSILHRDSKCSFVKKLTMWHLILQGSDHLGLSGFSQASPLPLLHEYGSLKDSRVLGVKTRQWNQKNWVQVLTPLCDLGGISFLCLFPYIRTGHYKTYLSWELTECICLPLSTKPGRWLVLVTCSYSCC